MMGRLTALGRSAYAWSGVLLLTAVALVALANLGWRLVRVLPRAQDPEVLVGLLGLGAVLAGAAVVLAGGWLLAVRGRLGLGLALVAGLLLLAAVRLAIGLQVDSHLDGEMRHFDALARGMLAGECCFAERATGYPLLLAGAYAVLGPGPGAGEALNLLLGLVAGGALFALLYAHAGRRAAVLGLYLLALWPAGALLSNSRLSETLYIAVLLLAALVTLHDRGLRTAVLAGALLAAAHYVRPTSLALLPAFVLARIWPATPLRPALLRTLLPISAASLLLLSPVVAYNLQAHGELSLSTSAYGGWSLYMGTDPRSGGRYSDVAAAEIEALTPGGLWQDSAAAGRVALERVSSDPLALARLTPVKFNTLWGSEDFGLIYGLARGSLYEPEMTFAMLASSTFYTLIAGLAAVAVFRRRHNLDRLTALCVGLSLIVAFVHLFVEVRDRYHAYLTPLFIALVALEAPRWLAARTAGRGPAGRPGGVPA